jgi:formylglycine-generating enzyme required for sulfatase activity
MAAKKRPWREVVKMFIEVGKGLAGAHAEGLIHRDFKPDNVLIDKNGVPKVVDFGLVRLNNAALDRSTSGSLDLTATQEDEDASLPVAQTALAALTRTGALTGTPAYMAPEQFLGKEIDSRTDQFAFCIALWEALYGERPFAGDTVIGLAESVTSGRIKDAPKDSQVPTWVRRALLRGLSIDPANRLRSFDELTAILANDPIAKRRRQIAIFTAAAIVIGGVLTARHFVLSKRREIDDQVAEHVRRADSFLADAATKRHEFTALRDRSFAAFDSFERDRGEVLWAQSIADGRLADGAYQRGIQRLEAAVTLAPRPELKERIADTLLEYIQFGQQKPGEREVNLKMLASYDETGARQRQLNAPAALHLQTVPAGVGVRIEQYDLDSYQPLGPPRDVGATPIDLTLPPGSYRLSVVETAANVGFFYPVLLSPGARVAISQRIPPKTLVPKNFAFVPEGRFLFGSSDEELRTEFLETTPLHEITTPAFLIARYETTIGDWIAFLDHVSAKERAARRPQGRKDLVAGLLDVRQNAAGAWEIFFRATNKLFHAEQGETFHYSERDRRAAQDWSRFPVAAVSAQDALAYVAWLNSSGRVPGARLCTEQEWERAARGADSRRLPHGNQLLYDDANFDRTYGRRSGGYGPDEVGSHPRSVSPFGVWDLVGNVWDITASTLDRGQFVARGGSFYQNTPTMVIPNRNPISSVTRDHTVGLRVCANVQF